MSKRKIEEEETEETTKQTVSKRQQKLHDKKLPGYSRFPKRVRAHCNPLADEYYEHPVTPQDVNWSEMYPNWDASKDKVTILDVGCAFGGLITSIAPVKPQNHILGIEIRNSVVSFTQERIVKLRNKDSSIAAFQPIANKEEVSKAQLLNKPDPNHDYGNVWAIRSNAMKYLPCYFNKGQLEKIFFMFPDPHFVSITHISIL